jgi:hypothetical protein
MDKKSRTNATHHRSNHLHFDDELKDPAAPLGTQLSLIVPQEKVGSGVWDALGRGSRSSVIRSCR